MKAKYVLFDGDCGFCNHTIMFIANRDSKENFTFVSSLSKFGNKLLNENKLKGVELETLILFENENEFYTKSKAIQKMLIDIPNYKIIGYLMFLIPRFIMDSVYMAISKRRKIIIKGESCEIPEMNIRRKFILKKNKTATNKVYILLLQIAKTKVSNSL